MPTVLRQKGYRFFFYVNDHSPLHIHVEKESGTAKFQLEPVELTRSKRLNASELSEIRHIVSEQKEFLKSKWNEHFDNQ